jgi:chromosome segregation ATPase
MSYTVTLMTILLSFCAGGLVSWVLASVRAPDARAVAVMEVEEVRKELGTQLAAHIQQLSVREAELTSARSMLDDIRTKATTFSEERVRFEAMYQSEQRVSASHIEEIARLRATIANAEGVHEAESSRLSALEADAARLTATLEELRASHEGWASAARATEAELKARLAEAIVAADAARTRAATLDTDVARLTTMVEHERKAHAERMRAHLEAEDHFKAAVKATAADALSASRWLVAADAISSLNGDSLMIQYNVMTGKSKGETTAAA